MEHHKRHYPTKNLLLPPPYKNGQSLMYSCACVCARTCERVCACMCKYAVRVCVCVCARARAHVFVRVRACDVLLLLLPARPPCRAFPAVLSALPLKLTSIRLNHPQRWRDPASSVHFHFYVRGNPCLPLSSPFFYFVNSRTLMGSVASYLCHFMLMCVRLHIPMTRRNVAGTRRTA